MIAGQAVGDQPAVGGHVGCRSARARRSTGSVRCESATTAPWPGKVLGGRRHAGLAHAVHVGHRQLADRLGAGMEGAVADDLARRRSRGPRRARRRCRPRERAAPRPSASRVRAPAPAPLLGSRSNSWPMRRVGGRRENPVRKRCTRPPSWSTATMSGGERAAWIASTRTRELRRIGVVAGEEDHAAHQRMAQQLALLRAHSVGDRRSIISGPRLMRAGDADGRPAGSAAPATRRAPYAETCRRRPPPAA